MKASVTLQNINDPTRTEVLDTVTWRAAIHLAEEFGWNPNPAMPKMIDLQNIQRLSATDARALADVLDRATGSNGPASYPLYLSGAHMATGSCDDLLSNNRDYLWALLSPMPDLIDFCRKGAFSIG